MTSTTHWASPILRSNLAPLLEGFKKYCAGEVKEYPATLAELKKRYQLLDEYPLKGREVGRHFIFHLEYQQEEAAESLSQEDAGNYGRYQGN